MSDTFTCDACGQTFPKAWSDEEARAEYDAAFPDGSPDGEEPGIVCDDCWQGMQEVFATLKVRYILAGLPGGPPLA